MQRYLSGFDGPIYALLRMVAGFLFLCHGAQKLFGLFGGPPAEMPAAALYAFAFLLIAARGAGVWSLDAARGGGE